MIFSEVRQVTPEQQLGLHSGLLASTHSFFQARDIKEVFTPCIVSQAHSEYGIESFSIDSMQHNLRNSPEYEMKRLLMTARTDIYQIAPVFRKGEYGKKHRPEFIMLEWYRLGWNYRRLMDECLEYLQTMMADANIKLHLLSYRQLLGDVFDCNPFDCETAVLTTLAEDLGLQSSSLTHAECLDFLFEIASRRYSATDYPDTLVAIYDFPIEQASFARISEQGVAERFEIFLNGIELANGYGELTRAEDYYERVHFHNRIRKTQLSMPLSMDEDFMQTLKQYGLAECVGVSVGIERLLMCKAHAEDIAQVSLL